MSEAGLFSAFHASLNAANTVLYVYLSLITGFLLLSYLVADKLSGLLASIVVSLFSATAGLLIFRLVLNRNDAHAIMNYMLEQKTSGKFDLH